MPKVNKPRRLNTTRIKNLDELPDDVRNVIIATSYTFRVSAYDLYSPIRQRNITDARHVAMTIIHENYGNYGKGDGYTLMRIGKFFNRDHTTVIHAIQCCKNMCQTDEAFFQKYKSVYESAQLLGRRPSVPKMIGIFERLNRENALKACEIMEEMLELQLITEATEQMPVIPKKRELLTNVENVNN